MDKGLEVKLGNIDSSIKRLNKTEKNWKREMKALKNQKKSIQHDQAHRILQGT